MNFHKYFQYVYLVIAILFVYDAFSKYSKGESFWVSLLFGTMAVFMFFFKRNFAKKYDQNKKK